MNESISLTIDTFSEPPEPDWSAFRPLEGFSIVAESKSGLTLYRAQGTRLYSVETYVYIDKRKTRIETGIHQRSDFRCLCFCNTAFPLDITEREIIQFMETGEVRDY